MAGKHSFGIRIDHKHGFTQGIKQDGIGGLRPDPLNCQQLLAQENRILSGEMPNFSGMMLKEKLKETFKPGGFKIIISGASFKAVSPFPETTSEGGLSSPKELYPLIR